MYSLTDQEKKVLREYLDDNLHNGLIAPSNSPAGAPLFFVPKKTKDLRPCVDFRELNRITIKDRYPLPLIRDIPDAIQGAKIFTKLDLRGAYHLLWIKEGDEWKTAFRTPFGHYEYRVMPFGVTNAPSVFQRFMDSVFSDVLNQYVVIYLDDILIYSRDPEHHVDHVLQVLERLKKNQLFCKPEKCEFHKSEVRYLGFCINQHGISMDPDKVSAILDWPSPTSIKETQCFLGLSNFYRQFIQNFAHLQSFITQTIKKENLKKGFIWTKEAEHAFQELKTAFTQAPVLRHPDNTKKCIVVTDASDRAIGAVLLQKQDNDGLEHPIFYLSHILSEAERNYSVLERELLALKVACKEWRHFLMGSREPFEARTDHRNLQCLRSFQCRNSRQARWAFFFSQYDFVITYIPGSQNLVADALSRRYPDIAQNSSPHLIESSRIIGATQSFQERIQSEYQFLSASEWDKVTPFLQKKDNYFYHQHALFLPTKKVQTEALQMCHDSPIASHRGIRKTQELLQRYFWWPSLKTDTETYVSACPVCAQTKTPRTKVAGLLRPLPVPSAPWCTLSTDFICSLPTSSGNQVIMVTVDSFTKMAHFSALKKLPTAPEMSRIFLRDIFRLHGLPLEVISDRGPQYVSRFWRAFCAFFNIEISLSSGFHPQTNGQTERVNQELQQYLRCYCNATQSNWSEYLALAEFSYNNTIHSATKTTPFYCTYGFHPRTFTTVSRTSSSVPAVTSFSRQIRRIQGLLHTTLLASKQAMKRKADRYRQAAPLYQVGHKVWLSSRFLPSRFSTNKFKPRFYAPFRISHILNPVVVRLRLPHTWRVHPVFHVSQLKPFVPDPYHRQFQCPPPLSINGQPEYEVQEICDSRIFRRNYSFWSTGKDTPSVTVRGKMLPPSMLPVWFACFLTIILKNLEPRGGDLTVTPRSDAASLSVFTGGTRYRYSERRSPRFLTKLSGKHIFRSRSRYTYL
ncbi:hypothetical protein NDU88_009435 [Pleurodeles waltl]|uniref:Gypsy retrotransposon integrase-like protein 1 n=1 Tax=Pleurodeles waltl TaxID=8319 RepID=A0AAV7P271_PLEWA|nr:hypothetical protein NDU88_009435 [Pleurodeles waltl]